jgi:hypothetical protein
MDIGAIGYHLAMLRGLYPLGVEKIMVALGFAHGDDCKGIAGPAGMQQALGKTGKTALGRPTNIPAIPFLQS